MTQPLSDWLRRFAQARDLKKRAGIARELPLHDLKLQVQSIKNRATGKSMGEHSEETAKAWEIGRAEQDAWALDSHRRAVAGQERGFFAPLIVPVDGVEKDAFPRKETSPEKLAALPLAFDRTSGHGTHTAGNSSPLTDGAAGLWVATRGGPEAPAVRSCRGRASSTSSSARSTSRATGCSWHRRSPIPRLLARNGLTYADVDLWEIHEAFAAQVALPARGARLGDLREGQGARRGAAGHGPARPHQPERRQRRAGPSLRRHRRAHPRPGPQRARPDARGDAAPS